MQTYFARNWWKIALRGVCAVLFGIAAIFWPGTTLQALIWLFGVYAVADGILAIGSSIRAAEQKTPWWPWLLEGLVGIAVGVITLLWPGITAVALVYLIAAWAIVTGILEVVAAFELGFWMGVNGVLSVIAGVLLMIYPDSGILLLVWFIGAYAVVGGIALIVLGFKVRNWQPTEDQTPTSGTVATTAK